jgi:hypothetical protein
MGDPVTTGILIGAAMGGGTAAIKGQDPLKAALIGGATGGIGGGFAGGFSGAAGAAPTGIMGSAAGYAPQVASPTFMQQLSGGAMGVKDMFSGANTFMNQNPFTAQAGMSLAKSAFEPEQPMQMAPSGQVNRGQVQPMDYMSLLNPQQQSVIRPPQISLLG